jgi:hypothetical protein
MVSGFSGLIPGNLHSKYHVLKCSPTVFILHFRLFRKGRTGMSDMINVPALMQGLPQDAYMSEFIIETPDTGSTDEEIVTDEFDMGGDM